MPSMISSTAAKWIRNRSDEAAVDQGCWFDHKAADRVRFFFHRFLRHSKGADAGKPFELLDWEWDRVVAPLYGWKKPDGYRRFVRAGIGIPKKNGKSTLFAGLSQFGLLGDGEPGAEIYSAGADREQAGIIYNEAANMVEASEALLRHLQVRRASKTIRFPAGRSIYKALSADVPTKEGLNIHYLLFDELHAQKTRALWDALKYGGAARRQPLILWISTAGYDRSSLCYEQWQRARAIQESRTIDVSFLPCIYEPAEGDDWESEATWQKVNPSYGVTVNPSTFRQDFDEAKAVPSTENAFKRYHLNIWTEQATRWIPWHKWKLCAANYTEQSDASRSTKCLIGLDLATTTDIAAAVILYKNNGKWRVWPMFWVPEENERARELSNRDRLREWIRLGLITVTPGDVIDYNRIRADLNNLADRWKVKGIIIDPWNATQLATDLQDDGFTIDYCRTGFASMSPPTREFEKLVLGLGIEHPDNPVLNWMLANTAVEQDASGNIKPSKRHSSEKIDGIMAILLALSKCIVWSNKKSKYATQKVVQL
jgi:phage terminase large subunit-like protein